MLIGIVYSCQKGAQTADNGTVPVTPKNMGTVRSKMSSMHSVDAFALHFGDRMKDKCRDLTKRLDDVKHHTESFIDRCKEKPGKSHRHDSHVIYVPQDYPTLQAAVDVAPVGGRIVVCGTVPQSGNVLINTANLCIEGQEGRERRGEHEGHDGFATLKDTVSTDNLVITAPGVTVKNLKLVDIGIQINNPATGVTLANDKVINNNLSNPSIITLTNSSRNEITDCSLTGSGVNADGQIGILLDSLSNHNEIEDCSIDNTDFAAYNITGSDNQIKHCRATNYNLGFAVFNFLGTTSTTGNVFTDCNADNCAGGSGFLLYANEVGVFNCSANNCVNAVVNVSLSSRIIHCSGNGCFQAFINYLANDLTVSECTANQCGYSGIQVEICSNFKLTHNTSNGGTGSGIMINNYSGNFSKGVLEDNKTNGNTAFGIYLNSVANSTIRENKSVHNGQCDFDQTNCSANVVSHNQFGNSCSGM